MRRLLLQRSQQFIISLGVIPILLAFAGYRTSSQNVESVEAVLSTDNFIRTLDELLSTIQDAETGQRGYLLTGGQERYLIPFVEAQQQLKDKLSAVNVLAAQNGVQQQDISRLDELVNAKMSELEKTVGLRRAGQADAALQEVETGRGREYMTGIRALMSRLKQAQLAVFDQRLQQQRQSHKKLNVVLGLGVVLAFVFVVIAYRLSAAYARERDQTEQEIRLLNSTLELRVNERTQQLEARSAELEQRSAALQRSNDDLMTFGYAASHDLQEPLRMVSSYVALLARRYQSKLDETAQRYIQFAIDGTQRMQILIQDLLAYSRAGTEAVEKKPVALEEVVETAIKNLELPMRETFAVVRHNGLPLVHGDEVKLGQVIQNLLANAIKFHKPGICPEISISAHRNGDNWTVAVSDNGIGFDPKYSDRIFQVFQRLHGVSEYPGTGIGLAVSRRIIQHHGGRLWAESQPDIGSTFYFTLPEAAETGNGSGSVARTSAAQTA